MTEGQIQAGYRAWLDKMGLYYICPRTDKRSTIKEGAPDFHIMHCNRCLLIESKDAKGKLSKKQEEVHYDLRKQGGIVVRVCRSVEDHIRVTQEWLGTLPSGPEWQTVLNPPSAVVTPETDNNASGAVIGGKESLLDSAMHYTPGYDGTHILFNAPVNGKTDGNAWVGNPNGLARVEIDKSGERIGRWQNQSWLIRADAKGNEEMIRIATAADKARLGVNV